MGLIKRFQSWRWTIHSLRNEMREQSENAGLLEDEECALATSDDLEPMEELAFP